jgi:hypothetical protein
MTKRIAKVLRGGNKPFSRMRNLLEGAARRGKAKLTLDRSIAPNPGNYSGRR